MQATPPNGVEQILQYTNRWIDNPVIDLMSPEGTFVRAAVESLDRVRFGAGQGIKAIEDAGYPGFTRAFNGVDDLDDVAGNARKDQAIVGTLYWEVVRFSVDQGVYTAGVCSYGSMAATKVWNGYKSSGRRSSGSARVISFRPDPTIPPDQQRAPKSHQRGPAGSPVNDVFGTWVLSENKVLGANVELPQCEEKLAPGTPPDAPEDYYVSTEPPPTLSPIPGWPEAPNE
ncbi:hypothetical protein ACQI4L_26330 [Mycolicibacterium litorale]|uniref:hypothetical protein n=1 Tax=Mycolicibacterium litorale TaxID=758802 RepID=UPI003CF392E9